MHLCLLIFVCFEVRVRAGKIGPLTACTEVRAARILNGEARVSAPVCLHQVVTLTAPARTHTDTYKGCEYRKVFSDERLTPPPITHTSSVCKYTLTWRKQALSPPLSSLGGEKTDCLPSNFCSSRENDTKKSHQKMRQNVP